MSDPRSEARALQKRAQSITDKAELVWKSCRTEEQLEVARRYHTLATFERTNMHLGGLRKNELRRAWADAEAIADYKFANESRKMKWGIK